MAIKQLTISLTVTTFVACSSCTLMFLGSLYYKQYGPRSGFILFASMKKFSLKCTWTYAADIKSRQHFQNKNSSGRMVASLVILFFCRLLIFFKINFEKFFQKYQQSVKQFGPKKARHFVRPGLGPNCLHRLSTDYTSRQRVGKENASITKKSGL